MQDRSTKEDIARIVFLSKKSNYGDLGSVLDIINKYDNKSYFRSAFGQRYMKRLKDIAIGMELDGICVLCNNNTAENKVVCNECVTKISDAISKNSQASEYRYIEDEEYENRHKKRVVAGIAIAAVIVLTVVIIGLLRLFGAGSDTAAGQMDMIDYIGLDASSANGVYEESCFVTGSDGNIAEVRINADNDSAYSIAGVHVGDDHETMTDCLKMYGAVVNEDEDNTDPSVENYLINQNGNIYNLRFYIKDGTVSGIEGYKAETAEQGTDGN